MLVRVDKFLMYNFLANTISTRIRNNSEGQLRCSDNDLLVGRRGVVLGGEYYLYVGPGASQMTANMSEINKD